METSNRQDDPFRDVQQLIEKATGGRSPGWDSGDQVKNLQQVIEKAIESGADSVEMEHVPYEGLEVTYMYGCTGIGFVIADRKVRSEIIGSLVDKAGLEDKTRGVIRWTYSGKQYAIAVEEYESFGESCFRLKFKKPKRKR